MKNQLTRTLAIAIVGCIASTTFAQQTFTYAGPVLCNPGGGTDFLLQNPVTTAYTLQNKITLNSGTLTPTAAGTLSSEAVIRLTNSAFPATVFSFIALPGGAFTSPLNVIPNTVVNLSAASSQAIPVGSTWKVNFYDSADDGADFLSDETWTNISFSTQAPPTVAQTLVLTQSRNVVDFRRDSDNITNVYPNAVATPFVLNAQTTCVGQLQRLVAGTTASSCAVRLRNSAWPFHVMDVFPVSGAFDGTGFNNFNTTSTSSTVLGQSLVGLTIPAGSTWTSEFFYNVASNNNGISEAKFNTLSIALFTGVGVQVSGPPSNTVDLGSLNTTVKTVTLPAGAALQNQWYKIQIAEIGAGKYLDLEVKPSLANPNVATNTAMGIYTADGRRIASDTFDGEFEFPANNSMPAISIGRQTPVRFGTATGTMDPTVDFDGRDGEGLSAGNYYIVIARSGATFSNAAFTVNALTTANPADNRLILSTNAPLTGQTVSGTVTLQDWTIDAQGRVCSYQILNGASVQVASGNTTLGVGGAYSIFAPGLANGTYTLVLKSSHWLASASPSPSLVLTGSLVTQNFSLINGDVNDDNFVGFDDFDILSASFNLSLGDPGYQAGADLNGDDFVGFDDFDILSANFNLSGD